MIRYGILLPHSREHELEADATGLRITARALYDPGETAGFFDRLLEFSEATGSSPRSSWRSTHPKHEQRIQALQEQEASARVYYERKLKQAEDQRKRDATRAERAVPATLAKERIREPAKQGGPSGTI